MAEEKYLQHLQIDIEKDSEVVKIKDIYGRIVFIIQYIVLEDDNPNGKYLVKVKEITPKNEIKDIFREFYDSNSQETARTQFKKLIMDYQIFTESIKEPVNPREIFNDAVNYHKINPKRCENCIFCVFKTQEGEGVVKTLCSCKKNIRQNEFTWDIFEKYSESERISCDWDMIEIERDCICNNYSKISEEEITKEGEY